MFGFRLGGEWEEIPRAPSERKLVISPWPPQRLQLSGITLFVECFLCQGRRNLRLDIRDDFGTEKVETP